jgi:hypothetical protein
VVADKTKRALVWGALLGVVAFVLTRRSAAENPLKTSEDFLAALMNLVLLLSMFAVAGLTRGPAGRRKLGSINIFLALALIAVAIIVAMWSGPRMVINVAMLVLIAYNAGRWRGHEERNVVLSDSPLEIWSR